DQPSLKYNHEIQTISQDVNKLLYEEAIKSASEVNALRVNNGSGIMFSEQTEKALMQLDKKHLSKLNPNNRKALETIISGLHEDSRYQNFHTAVSFDYERASAKISLYKPSDSTSVLDSLSQGKE